jgi:hypothetical protein
MPSTAPAIAESASAIQEYRFDNLRSECSGAGMSYLAPPACVVVSAGKSYERE